MIPFLDEMAVRAGFSQPDPDGTFAGAFGEYLRRIAVRPAVIFAFPPKAGGTFLRTAAITAIDGQLLRIGHAQGGLDAQPYLPLFIAYHTGAVGNQTMVAHAHMQALPANRRFIEALDLRPIIMMRPVADMLASYWDMLETDDIALEEGLNCRIPRDFRSLARERKADFLIDVVAPWYAGYYATWLEYAGTNPGRVCMLTYAELSGTPAGSLERALTHAQTPCSRESCEAACATVWKERKEWRFNRGIAGRGRTYFNWRQIARIGRMLSYYPSLDGQTDSLAA
jgi:hypothetical protein